MLTLSPSVHNFTHSLHASLQVVQRRHSFCTPLEECTWTQMWSACTLWTGSQSSIPLSFKVSLCSYLPCPDWSKPKNPLEVVASLVPADKAVQTAELPAAAYLQMQHDCRWLSGRASAGYKSGSQHP